MAKILAERSNVDAIHIVSHGASGQVNLGSLLLDAKNIDLHSGDLATIGAALKADGDILLYGCSVGATEAGKALLGDLAIATGADIAASSNLTGSTRWGGDWDLEVKTGSIEAAPVVSEELANFYNNLLIGSVTVGFDSGANLLAMGGIYAYQDAAYNVGGNKLKINGKEVGVVIFDGSLMINYGGFTKPLDTTFYFDDGAIFSPDRLSILSSGADNNLTFKGYDSGNNLIATKTISIIKDVESVINFADMTSIAKLVLTATGQKKLILVGLTQTP